MRTQPETFLGGFAEGIAAVATPGSGLTELRQEMRQRNAERAALIRSLSYSSRRHSSNSTSSRSQ